MVSPGVVPAVEPVKKEFSWKHLFIKAAGFGAGFALMLAVLAGMGLWYFNRPKPPKPWDSNAIKSTYYRVSREQEGNKWKLDFLYILENTTENDYELRSASQYRAAAKLQDTNSLTGFDSEDEIALKLPIFIPAHQKTRIELSLPSYDVDVPTLTATPTDEELHKYYVAVEEAISKKMANLDGFTIFDEVNRYQINLPGTWKSKSDKKTTATDEKLPQAKKQ